MPDIATGLARQRNRLAEAALRAGRAPGDVLLVAVSKGQPPALAEAAVALGQLDLGESYVQEWRSKAASVRGRPLRWHFVGHVQSNKARALATGLTLLHSVDRMSLIQALERDRSEALDVLVQVNVSAEDGKFGCDPSEAEGLVRRLAGSPTLRARGLMTIAPLVDDPEEVRVVFRGLRELRDRVRDRLVDLPVAAGDLVELSMGMSGDAEVAVEEGATIVRVGTAIFGPRPG